MVSVTARARQRHLLALVPLSTAWQLVILVPYSFTVEKWACAREARIASAASCCHESKSERERERERERESARERESEREERGERREERERRDEMHPNRSAGADEGEALVGGAHGVVARRAPAREMHVAELECRRHRLARLGHAQLVRVAARTERGREGVVLG